jgi:hypothetical protein
VVGWEKAAPLLLPAIRQSAGMYEPEDVRDLVTSGRSQLWLLAEGNSLLAAWVTKLLHYPRGTALEITFAGGNEMARWYDLALSETEKFGRELGCSRLRCGGRRGWEKHGYRLIGHLFERAL